MPAGREAVSVRAWMRSSIASRATSSGRPAVPEEIASPITYLAGDEASFVHGAVLDVDGGRRAA
jgi:NAD(P)-dependent dehydrogenase (short-subunit alcohol dehydrogenase family)